MFRMPKKEIFGDAHLAGVPDSVHFAACKASGNALTKGMPIYGTYAATKAAPSLIRSNLGHSRLQRRSSQ
jgi:hypothetical protein